MIKEYEKERDEIIRDISNTKQELIVCKIELVRHEETTKKAIERVKGLVRKQEKSKKDINKLFNKLVRLIR